MTDEEIVAALAEALRAFDAETRAGIPDEDLAAALLPVVRRVAEQRAAEELKEFEAVASEWELEAVHAVAGTGWRRAHARCAARIRTVLAALTATPSHGRNAT